MADMRHFLIHDNRMFVECAKQTCEYRATKDIIIERELNEPTLMRVLMFAKGDTNDEKITQKQVQKRSCSNDNGIFYVCWNGNDTGTCSRIYNRNF